MCERRAIEVIKRTHSAHEEGFQSRDSARELNSPRQEEQKLVSCKKVMCQTTVKTKKVQESETDHARQSSVVVLAAVLSHEVELELCFTDELRETRGADESVHRPRLCEGLTQWSGGGSGCGGVEWRVASTGQ